MISGYKIIEHLRDYHNLTAQEYRSLIENDDRDFCDLLSCEARRATESVYGRRIYIRGLIEISNICRNNCFYCGIRAANTGLERYRLTKEEILECCRSGYDLGFRTFVLQGGEDPLLDDGWLETLITEIHRELGDCAITLSLGERSPESYRRLKEAGAERYLLRHETYNPDHYRKLHPAGMSRDNRLRCLSELKALGYQTGSGIMVGSPYQTPENVVEDLLFLEELRPEMVGIGPFIHHNATPFASFRDGSVAFTLKLISILRLMNPEALIPATTALATLEPNGRIKAILAGANVVMPNLTPAARRGQYALYEGKAASGAESAEGLDKLKKELAAIGYAIEIGRGDPKRRQCTT